MKTTTEKLIEEKTDKRIEEIIMEHGVDDSICLRDDIKSLVRLVTQASREETIEEIKQIMKSQNRVAGLPPETCTTFDVFTQEAFDKLSTQPMQNNSNLGKLMHTEDNYTQKFLDGICNHCSKPIEIGANDPFCDHLYYPENCEICKKREDHFIDDDAEKTRQTEEKADICSCSHSKSVHTEGSKGCREKPCPCGMVYYA